jgi:hypothetical protein
MSTDPRFTIQDNHDTVKLLKSILEKTIELNVSSLTADVEDLKASQLQLEKCLTYFRQTDYLSPSEDETSTILNTIEHVKTMIGKINPSALSILNEKTWKNHFPRELHISGVPHLLNYGAKGWSRPPSRLFSVRGKDYLDDDVKVSNARALYLDHYVDRIRR